MLVSGSGNRVRKCVGRTQESIVGSGCGNRVGLWFGKEIRRAGMSEIEYGEWKSKIQDLQLQEVSHLYRAMRIGRRW